MIYGQIVAKKCGNNFLHVKFIYYRKDLDLIIYEYNKKIYQDPAKLFSVIPLNEIEQLYDQRINKKKRKINKIKKRLNKPSRKEYLDSMKKFNIQIKELKQKIDDLTTINALTNSGNKNLVGLKIRLTNMKKRKDRTRILYEHLISSYRRNIKNIQRNKNILGNLKQDRKKIVFDENDNNIIAK